MSLARLLAAALAVALGACGAPPPAAPLVVADGEYRMEQWAVSDPLLATEAVRGHPTTQGRTLTFDRAARRVTVRYVRDGRAVVETWRVTPQ